LDYVRNSEVIHAAIFSSTPAGIVTLLPSWVLNPSAAINCETFRNVKPSFSNFSLLAANYPFEFP